MSISPRALGASFATRMSSRRRRPRPTSSSAGPRRCLGFIGQRMSAWMSIAHGSSRRSRRTWQILRPRGSSTDATISPPRPGGPISHRVANSDRQALGDASHPERNDQRTVPRCAGCSPWSHFPCSRGCCDVGPGRRSRRAFPPSRRRAPRSRVRDRASGCARPSNSASSSRRRHHCAPGSRNLRGGPVFDLAIARRLVRRSRQHSGDRGGDGAHGLACARGSFDDPGALAQRALARMAAYHPRSARGELAGGALRTLVAPKSRSGALVGSRSSRAWRSFANRMPRPPPLRALARQSGLPRARRT